MHRLVRLLRFRNQYFFFFHPYPHQILQLNAETLEIRQLLRTSTQNTVNISTTGRSPISTTKVKKKDKASNEWSRCMYQPFTPCLIIGRPLFFHTTTYNSKLHHAAPCVRLYECLSVELHLIPLPQCRRSLICRERRPGYKQQAQAPTCLRSTRASPCCKGAPHGSR